MGTNVSFHLGGGRLSVDGTGLHDPAMGGTGGYVQARHSGGLLTIHADDLDALAVSLQAMADAAAEAAGRDRAERAWMAS